MLYSLNALAQLSIHLLCINWANWKDSWPNWPSYQLRSLTKMGGSTTANGMLNLFVSTIKKAQHSLNHRMSPLENLTFLGSGIFDVQRNKFLISWHTSASAFIICSWSPNLGEGRVRDGVQSVAIPLHLSGRDALLGHWEWWVVSFTLGIMVI